jgi:alkylation response protein AidB-like acyl-CoA dehydrogenase
MPLDFEVSSETLMIVETISKIGQKKIKENIRTFEKQGFWPKDLVDELDSLEIKKLMLPNVVGGYGDVLAGILAARKLAEYDAGGIFKYDMQSALSGLFYILKDKYELPLSTLLEKETAILLLNEDESYESYKGKAILNWVPLDQAPDLFFTLNLETIYTFNKDALNATTVEPSACHASGGVKIELLKQPQFEIQIDKQEALFARAIIRLYLAAILCGIANSALDSAIEYGKERIVFNKPVLGHQANSFEIAGIWSEKESANIAIEVCAHLVSQYYRGEFFDISYISYLANSCYLASRRSCLEATDLAVLLFGGHGYMRDNLVEKYWREARHIAQLYNAYFTALDDQADLVVNTKDLFVV